MYTCIKNSIYISVEVTVVKPALDDACLLLATYRARSIPCSWKSYAFAAAHAHMSPQPSASVGPRRATALVPLLG